MGYRAWRDGYNDALALVVDRSGISRREVARRIGDSEDTIGSYFKKGSACKTPPADTLAAILKVVGGSADEVLGLSAQVADENARLRDALRGVEQLLAELRAPAGQAGKRGPAK